MILHRPIFLQSRIKIVVYLDQVSCAFTPDCPGICSVADNSLPLGTASTAVLHEVNIKPIESEIRDMRIFIIINFNANLS